MFGRPQGYTQCILVKLNLIVENKLGWITFKFTLPYMTCVCVSAVQIYFSADPTLVVQLDTDSYDGFTISSDH